MTILDKDILMRIFFSVGEPSGDLHGGNLIRCLQERRPEVQCVGFGGENMAEAGCELLYPLTQLAVMGFSKVIAKLPHFVSLLSQADRYFRHHRPDAVVLIDFPGFNWWIARRAHFHRIPVYYFVPPQLWAWASWRVKKMQRWVDHVLCSLPFEESWYRERGVTAEYVGHPFFDELPHQQLDAGFLAGQRIQPGRIVGLLPGSRTMEVERNFRSQLQAAQRIHCAQPHTRFLVACFKESQQKMAEEMRRQFPTLPLQTYVRKTPEIMALSQACIAVSGSVSLELLYHARPTAIVYNVSRLMAMMLRPLLKAKYITLVNLLADKPLFPEFAATGWSPDEVAGQVLHWLTDADAHANLIRELVALRDQVAQPGACARAADRIVRTLEEKCARAA